MPFNLAMSVLVVDDYNTMITILRSLLQQIGFTDIDNAADGVAALDKMHKKRYDLVISDWHMQPMNGYDLLCKVRSDPDLGSTPFIMVTTESKITSVMAARAGGVSNYIVKPFNTQTLKAKIEEVFAKNTETTSGCLVP